MVQKHLCALLIFLPQKLSLPFSCFATCAHTQQGLYSTWQKSLSNYDTRLWPCCYLIFCPMMIPEDVYVSIKIQKVFRKYKKKKVVPLLIRAIKYTRNPWALTVTWIYRKHSLQNTGCNWNSKINQINDMVRAADLHSFLIIYYTSVYFFCVKLK